MQKSKETTSKGSRSPAVAFIAAMLAFALSFMAFDANTLRAAFADEGAGEPAIEMQAGEPQADDSAVVPEEEAEAAEQEQPEQEEGEATELEGEDTSASARDGPNDDGESTPVEGDEGDVAAQSSEEETDDPAATAEEQVSSTVTFYSNAASQNPSILARKLVTAEAGQTVTVDVSDVTAAAPTAAEIFDGWLFRGDVVRDAIEIDPEDGNVDLYPVFIAGHWLRFSTGVAQGEATEVDSRFVGASEQAPAQLATSSRVGYAFDGWFTGSWNGESVSYGTQVTEPDGTVIDPVRLKELLGASDVELFAKWTGLPTTYRLVSWHENPDDENYSYAGFEIIGDEPDERAISGETTDVTELPEVAGFTPTSVEQRTIAGDGSTTVHAYYDRNVYEVLFHQGRSDQSALFTDLTITAKYGADVHDKWPKASEGDGAYTAAWYTLPDENSNVFVTGIGTMPLGGAHYYVKNDVGMNCNTVFRVQVVDGSNNFTDYVSQPFTTELSPWTTADDYKPIKGFMVNAASDDDAEAIREIPAGDKGAVHDSGFLMSAAVGAKYEEAPEVTEEGDVARHTLYFYYLRCQYDIVFEENGGPAVRDVEGVYYEAPLSGLAPEGYVPGETTFTAPGGMTYEFVGWYGNEDLYGEQFDFEGSEMPAGNIVLYAKWTPKKYLVQVDPAGGAFTNAAQSTFFQVSHGDPVGAIGVTRDYVADDGGDYVYEYAAFSGDREGSGYARYVLAQPGDEGKRYRHDAGVYTLFGWYELVDGVMSGAPFDFNAAVTHDTSIIARWQSEGVFDIAYNPVMRVDGGSVSGDIDVRLDDGYADLSPTFVMNTPTDIKSTDGKAYEFVGWKIVESFEEGAPTLVDELYMEGDGFVVDSELASDNTIHFQAVYREVADGEPGGETPGENEPGGETPGGNEPGGETPGGNEPGGEISGGNEPGGETPGGNEPGGETPGENEPGGEEPPAEAPEENVSEPGQAGEPTTGEDGDDVIVLGLGASPDEEEESENGSEAFAAEGDDAAATSEEPGGEPANEVAAEQQGEADESLPQTDDALLALAVAIAGIALISLGVALMARAMRRRHDELVGEEE